ncbi:hypothetical protein [Rhizobium sp. BK376]|uniref:hypothetical protein n=1 Tax=Rhizobium sp. BK376 TaxID=2512149 RepID=UPI001FDEF37B|nr:hypothetical protein [Rhizobium sp. BK376]
MLGGRNAARVNNVFFSPKATVRCAGEPIFRSRAARDLGCLLDVDPQIETWECLPLKLRLRDAGHIPDFLARYFTGEVRLVDACELTGDPEIAAAAARMGLVHQFVSRPEREAGWRLRNARDLLRYGNFRCPLGDRIRVMSALDEFGSFTVAEGLTLFREAPPMAGLASLILQRILTVDLDDELINPDSTVRGAER